MFAQDTKMLEEILILKEKQTLDRKPDRSKPLTKSGLAKVLGALGEAIVRSFSSKKIIDFKQKKRSSGSCAAPVVVGAFWP